MVGLVLVSHSEALVKAIADLARGVGANAINLAYAGGVCGIGEDEKYFGTNPIAISEAIQKVYSDSGVIVLMDLGSAILSSEMAIDMLPDFMKPNIVLSSAPLVEGAVSAAIQASLNLPLQAVLAEAQKALLPKSIQLGTAKEVSTTSSNIQHGSTITITIKNKLGLHARPSARIVNTIASFNDTTLHIINKTKNKGPVNAASINSIALLSATQNNQLEFIASGKHEQELLAAIKKLADDNFGDIDNATKPVPIAMSNNQPTDSSTTFFGTVLSDGITVGPIIHYASFEILLSEAQAENTEHEWEKFQQALSSINSEITKSVHKARASGQNDKAEILSVQIALLSDYTLIEATRNNIFELKMNAAQAWQKACKLIIAQYDNIDDAYIKGRIADLNDIQNRVLYVLTGYAPTLQLTEPSIVCAEDLSPSETANLDTKYILAVCLANGNATSHSSILLQSLEIPVMIGLGSGIFNIKQGTIVAVDTRNKALYVEPSDIAKFQQLRQNFEEKNQERKADSLKPAITKDGCTIQVFANVGSSSDADMALRNGAEGIGLLRTEFVFTKGTHAPTEDEQYKEYESIAKNMKDKPVYIRTLDIGGDKHLSWFNQKHEENPFLGQRAIRLSLQHVDMFKTQLKAIVRLAANYPARIMFPMIATLDELISAKSILAEVIHDEQKLNASIPSHIDTGIMIEIPAAALNIEMLAPHVDFFSIGSNDLAQYLMAAERGNNSVAYLLDYCQPALIKMLHSIINMAKNYNVELSMCGEMAGEQKLVSLLLGLGLRKLSIAPQHIPKIKECIRHIDINTAEKLAQSILSLETAAHITKKLEEQSM